MPFARGRGGKGGEDRELAQGEAVFEAGWVSKKCDAKLHPKIIYH